MGRGKGGERAGDAKGRRRLVARDRSADQLASEVCQKLLLALDETAVDGEGLFLEELARAVASLTEDLDLVRSQLDILQSEGWIECQENEGTVLFFRSEEEERQMEADFSKTKRTILEVLAISPPLPWADLQKAVMAIHPPAYERFKDAVHSLAALGVVEVEDQEPYPVRKLENSGPS